MEKIINFMKNELEIIERIKEVYPKNGLKKTKEILNIGHRVLKRILVENNIERSSKVNIDFTEKKFIYLLGLLWSDGHISKKNNLLGIECLETDMIKFKPILESVSVWSYYRRERQHKPVVNAYITDKLFRNLLAENDYLEKSTKSPNKIYSKIPKELKKYFMLGIVDGDGCFYFNKKQYARQFILTGTYEQDWSLFEDFFNEIEAKYSIIRIRNKKSGYSQFRITNKKDLINLGNLLYDDMIILDRKHQSWLKTIS